MSTIFHVSRFNLLAEEGGKNIDRIIITGPKASDEAEDF